MAKARITIEISNGFVDIYLNPEGRAALVEAINAMDADNEHFHLGPQDGYHDVATSAVAYYPDRTVAEWGKVYLRLDEWDQEHFPHVMKSDPPA